MSDPSATRPLYWSVRRELWENRSVYLAPLAVAALVLFALSISTVRLPAQVRAAESIEATPQQRVVKPYSMAPAPIMFVSMLVGMFYALDALYGERRDRSILFWKSMPVSDRTTMLAKASIPLVVLPLIAWILSVATFGTLMMLGTVVLLERRERGPVVVRHTGAAGSADHALRTGRPCAVVRADLRLAVPGLGVGPPDPLALGRAPVLRDRGRRAARQLRTAYIPALLGYRLSGAMTLAFSGTALQGGDINRLAQLDPRGSGQRGPVDRVDRCRGLPRRRDPAAPPRRAHLKDRTDD